MPLYAIVAILILAPIASAQDRMQVLFKEPAGMNVFWLTPKDGKTEFSKVPLETPGRYNFRQGAAYRLKLTKLPGHPGLELFPTLEIPPSQPATREFLRHNAVPISLTDDEIRQVAKDSYIVKAIYLPFPQNGDGPMATVSGQDAVGEAARRGHVLLVLRIGNIVEPPSP